MRREKLATGTLARFEGETLSTEQSKIRKEETKSKEKQPGTLLQRLISVRKTTLLATKIRYPFSTERTVEGPPKENMYSDLDREIPLSESAGLAWQATPEEEFNSKPPSLKEIHAAVQKARAKTAPGPNALSTV